MSGRFHYVAFDDVVRDKHLNCVIAYENVEDIIKRCHLTEGMPEVHKALAKLEESFMWIGKALKRVQIERDIESMEQLG